MTVRKAAAADRNAFLGLWAAYLAEVQGCGSDILPTPRTMAYFGSLFDAYLNGRLDGACLVAGSMAPGDIVGVTMAGLAGECPWDSNLGKVAYGWGTFVLPANRGAGLGSTLRQALVGLLAALDFDAIQGGVHQGSAVSRHQMERLGATPTVQFTYRLRGA